MPRSRTSQNVTMCSFDTMSDLNDIMSVCTDVVIRCFRHSERHRFHLRSGSAWATGKSSCGRDQWHRCGSVFERTICFFDVFSFFVFASFYEFKPFQKHVFSGTRTNGSSTSTMYTTQNSDVQAIRIHGNTTICLCMVCLSHTTVCACNSNIYCRLSWISTFTFTRTLSSGFVFAMASSHASQYSIPHTEESVEKQIMKWLFYIALSQDQEFTMPQKKANTLITIFARLLELDPNDETGWNECKEKAKSALVTFLRTYGTELNNDATGRPCSAFYRMAVDDYKKVRVCEQWRRYFAYAQWMVFCGVQCTAGWFFLMCVFSEDPRSPQNVDEVIFKKYAHIVSTLLDMHCVLFGFQLALPHSGF